MPILDQLLEESKAHAPLMGLQRLYGVSAQDGARRQPRCPGADQGRGDQAHQAVDQRRLRAAPRRAP